METHISLNIDRQEKVVYLFEAISLKDITNVIKSIDAENAEDYVLVFNDYIEQVTENEEGDITYYPLDFDPRHTNHTG